MSNSNPTADLTKDLAVMPLPKILYLPLPPKSRVLLKPEQYAKYGQALATGAACADVCAPANGTVGIPEWRQTATAEGVEALCLPFMPTTISENPSDLPSDLLPHQRFAATRQLPDDDDAQHIPANCQHMTAKVEKAAVAHSTNINNINNEKTINKTPNLMTPLASPEDFLRKMGIVGLGGAAMPSWRKFRRGAHTLLVNAMESDDALWNDRALPLAAWVRDCADALGVARVVVAVRDDMPPLADVEVRRLPVADYAMGAERALVRALFGVHLSPDQPAADYGILSFNLGTLAAIYDALCGRPMCGRYVTAHYYHRRRVLWLPFGATLRDAMGFLRDLDFAVDVGDFADGDTHNIICRAGGSESQINLRADAVICARTTALSWQLPASPPSSLRSHSPKTQMPCIRCGDCLPACPANISPLRLYALWQDRDITRMQNEEGLDACILCRRCDAVCPSHIPLTAAFTAARAEVRTQTATTQTLHRRSTRYASHLARQNAPREMAKLNPAQLAKQAQQNVQKKSV